MAKPLTRDGELQKQKVMDYFSELTSVRNPNRSEFISLFEKQFGEEAEQVIKSRKP